MDVFERWDKGEHFFGELGEKLLKLKDGEKIGNILSNCTICPIHNGSCHDFLEVGIYGVHPNKKGKLEKISICECGVEGAGERCPLNK